MKGIDDIKQQISLLTAEKRAELFARMNGYSRFLTKQRIRPRKFGIHVPLSSAQERLWLVDSINPDNSSQNTSGVMIVCGKLDVGAFREAVQSVVNRHEILRTAIRFAGNSLEQVVLDGQNVEFKVFDINDLIGCCELDGCVNSLSFKGGRISVGNDDQCASDIEHEVAGVLNDLFYREGVRRFDLESGFMIRVVVVRESSVRHYVQVVAHHIVFDGGSVPLMLDEVWSIYTKGLTGSLNILPVQYGDYAIWQRSMVGFKKEASGIDYWASVLDGMPKHLHFLYDNDIAWNRVSGSSARFPIEIPSLVVEQVKSYALGSGVTMFHVFLAAYACVLMRFSGSDDFAIGIPVSLRSRPEIQLLIGCFINMLAIRMDLCDDPSFGEFVREVRARVLDGIAHGDTPFEDVVSRLEAGRDIGSTPLFQCLFSFEKGVDVGFRKVGLDLEFKIDEFDLSNSIYDLAMELHYRDDIVTGWIDYSKTKFSRDYISCFSDCLIAVLENGIGSPETSVRNVALLHSSQYEKIVHHFNDTQTRYPKDALIHELFEQQVERTPEALAVQYEGKRLTYAALNAKANQLAHCLRGLKDASGAPLVGPDALVAISVERSLEMVVGLLGILKAGAAYVPVDPEYPADRIAYMLGDSQAKVLLTQRTLQERLQEAARGDDEGSGEILLLDDEATYAGQPQDNIGRQETGQTSRHLAYVIYTSGSTGQPKGVMNEHRGVVNRLVWMQEAYGLGEEDRVLQKTPFSFDVSVWEFFWTLLNGAGLVMAAPQGHRDAQYLVDVIERAGVTVVHFVPSMLQVFLASVQAGQCASLRQMVCSGEELPLALQQRCQERLPSVRLDNLYGPTEAAVDVTWWSCDPAQTEGRVPIGRPIANIRMYVLDEQRQPVPLGVAGELYIGGDGVARGYLNRPELTAERFVRDPFSEEAEARMYRTGDLGRWRPDGAIEYLGRNDFQVKIRGQRIELGEIEARLGELPQVREAVVLARQDSPGDQRLVAYWTARDEGAAGKYDAAADAADTGEGEETRQQQEVARLRDHLKAELPSYMVPGAFVKLDAMPLTPNGKVDRKALPAPDAEALVTHAYEAPQGPVEEVLAGIWQDLLGVERVGRHDSFFDLGGHSLLIVSMVEKLRQAGFEADIRQVFDARSLVELAAGMGEQGATERKLPANLIPEGCDRITPEMLPLIELTQAEVERIVESVPGGAANVQDIYPLAPLQEGVLFYHHFHRDNDPYVISAIVSFTSQDWFQRFAGAMEKVISRHDALRTAVLWEGLPQAVQVVYRHAELEMEPLKIVAGSKETDTLTCIREHLEKTSLVMDPGRAPLLRLQPVHVAGGEQTEGPCYGLITFHHVILDHVSLDVLMSEAVQILEGHEEALQEPVAYREFVAHSLDEEREAKAIAFFRQMLGDVDGQTAPFGLTDVHGDGTGIEELRRPLDDGLSQRIRARVRRLGMSAATLFHVAYGLVLARCASRDDVVFGSVLSGRMGGVAGADRTVGMFINTLPVRLKLKGADVLGAMHAMQTALVDLLKYEQTSLAQVQRGSGLGSDVALFSAMLNFRHSQAMQGAGKRSGIEVVGAQERTNYPFVVSVDDLGEGFALTAQTQARVVEPERVLGYMSCAVAEVVDALENAPDRELLSLEVVPQAEREQLINGFNATQVVYPKDALIHELFEQQVERTPEALAVQYEDERLTYAQLNAKANQLAHWLLGHGAGRGQCVAIVAPRGIPMLLAQLATLKAGGTYVPIDPAFPQERRLFMLQDCRAKVVLSGDAAVEAEDAPEAGQDVQWLDLDHALEAVASLPAANPGVLKAVCAEAAYVMYTSGSTGKPKGVAVPHRAISRLVMANGFAELTADDVIVHCSNTAFDASTLEVWGALLNGGRMLVVSHDQVLDTVQFGRIMQEGGATVLYLSAGLFNQVADQLAEVFAQLRYLIVGGDVLDASVIRRVLRNSPPQNLLNGYGPTETTTFAVTCRLNDLVDETTRQVPIGRPIGNTQVYILDGQGRPAPIGVTGEIHIGGDGVALDYLNRPELTAERFIPDPFSDAPDARMYRTGDLGYWRADGLIEFVGRNDFQVKVRGFRIELGEIEARLGELPEVKEVVVLAREDQPGDKRLVAYWTARDSLTKEALPGVEALREHLRAELPEYMVPSAFVRLEAMPLNTSGKVDRKALPAPDAEALVTHAYEAPQGPVEEVLAGIWQELLGVERVGRHDNFFDLGGHSLLIVSMVEKLRQAGFEADIRQVFDARSLVELAAGMGEQGATERKLPANLIPEGCDRITPEMLPLIELTQAEVERIVESVPGGAANVQDIYPLAPLQEGVLFYHHFHRDNDPYVISAIVSFTSQDWFQRFAGAMEKVISRHDALRTAVLWEGLPQAVQVVYRHAELEMEPLKIVAGSKETDTLTCIREHLEKTSLVMDPGRAPLLRLQPVHVAGGEQTEGPCYGLITFHHVILDHVSLDVLMSEAVQILEGHEEALQEPVAYREFVAHSLDEEREAKAIAFFRQMLGDVDGQTAPFGLTDVHGDGTGIEELRRPLDDGLSQRIRARVRRLGMSAATLFHVAYGLVLARCASRDDVVFGSVLSGRMGGVAGADRTVGMFINTLPVRLKLKGADVLGAMHAMQTALVDLLKYEQTSLAQVQRGSGLGSDVALFSAMLNFRHSQAMQEMEGRSGMMIIAARERTNYPFSVSVDDLGEGFALTAQTQARVVEPERVLGYMSCAVAEVVDALENAPDRELLSLEVVPQAEREQLINGFNATQVVYPKDALIHELFEQQVERTPEALAVQYEDERLTYAQLNAKANQLAHRLRSLKDASGAPLVGPDALVAISVERSLEMVVGLLGILKAGAAYVPVDPEYPADRIAYMLRDSQAKVLLTQRTLQERLQAAARVVDGSGPGISRPEDAGGVGESGAGAEGADAEGTGETAGGPGEVLLLDEESTYAGQPQDNIGREETGQTSRHLAYVIYTSGSTGRPKGVELAHGGVCNLATLQKAALGIDTSSRVLQFASFSFDACAWEVVMSLSHGASLHLSTKARLMPGEPLCALLQERGITHVTLPPTALSALGSPEGLECLKTLVAVGEACPPQLAQQWCSRTHFINAYGPTEGTVCATMYHVPPDWMPASGQGVPIGGPVANARIYILDEQKQPVPMGVTGEIYIGGDGVARGYLNREELTAERFVRDPFSDDPAARMYRSGDLGRWRADGTIEYQGRNDFQVKIRGFRIELGEIEARLAGLPAVREVLVVARGEAGQTGQGREDAASVPGATGDKRLVAYWVARQGLPEAEVPTAEVLRNHLKAELPPYMVPSAFVKLDEMPLTPNGKVDRKALPAPDAEALVTHAYEAPQGLVEEVLAGIWQELLGVERVGRHDNFFDLGGHSLLILQLLVNVQKRLGREIDLQTFYRVPSVAAMAGLIQVGAGPDDSNSTWEQMQRDAVLDPGLVAEAPPVVEVDAVRQVLLTGATGFLGAFVLRELQRRTSAHVTCVVRARDAGHGLQRLRDSLKRYVLEEDIEFDRLEVVTGDLSLPSLGLEEDVYEGLCERMDAIYHCGAYVNHLMPYEQMQQANVEGTRELIRMAARHHAKYLNFVSTTSVLTPEDAAGREMLRESSLPRHGEHLHGGYVQTKWVAERLVEQARERGIPVSIHRAGRVSGDSEHGACQLDDSFWGVVRAIAVLGAAPEREFGETLTAVDQIAAAIVVLSQSAVLCNRTWHPVALGVSDRAAILAALRRGGYTIREVSDRVWRDEALRFFEAHPDDPSARLGAFLFKSAGSGHQDAPVREAVPVSSAVTRDAAQALGVELLPASVDMLDRSVSYFRSVGFLQEAGLSE